MISLPLQFLHLETAVFPLFILMVILTQLGRASEPGHYTQSVLTQTRWLQVGFVLLTLGLGASLAHVSPLLALELAAVIILALLHPANALCFFIFLLFLRPWEIVVDNPMLLSLPRLLALLCVVSWMLHPGHRGRPTAETFRKMLPLIGFSVWLFLSTFQAPHSAEVQSDWWQSYFKVLVVFPMCLFLIDTQRTIVEFEFTLMISALALMAVGFYQFLTGVNNAARLDSVGMFGDPNDLAAVVVIVIPFALAPFLKKGSSLIQQAVGGLYALFAVMIIWFTQSRGAMLALVVQFFVTRLLHSAREKWLGTLVLAGVLGMGYFVAIHAISRSAEDTGASGESRLIYWKAAVNMTLHHPIAGVGFEQYPENYEAYSSGVRYEWGKRTAHSSWFLVFAETGLIGGILYVSFFWAVLKTAWRNREQWPAQFLALVGYGVVMSFLSHTYSLYVPLLAGLILASDAYKRNFANVL